MKKKCCISIICVFMCFLIVPSILSLAKGQRDFSVRENRALTVRPSLSMSDILDGCFQEDYENYLNDQFMFRDALVSAKTYAYKCIGMKDINGIYLGKDNYLIEKYLPTDFDESLYQGNIDSLTTFLNDSTNSYDRVSCVIIPSKSSVLSNKLPNYAKTYNTDFISKSIRDGLNSNVSFLDLQDVLVSHNLEYIYYKTDHHWTSLGALYAYNEIRLMQGKDKISVDKYNKQVVTKSFLGSDCDKLQIESGKDEITTYTLNDKSVIVDYNGDEETTNSIFVKNFLNEKDKYAYFLGGNYKKINIKTNVKNNKKLFVIKDSFCNSIVPYLINDYEEIVLVDLRYCDESVYNILESENGITDIMVMYNTEKFMNDYNQWMLDKAIDE